jgi:FkbM family methyltransferase
MLGSAPTADRSLSRRIRRAGLDLVAPSHRARLRALYEAATSPRSPLSAAVAREDGAVRVSFNPGPTLLVAADALGDVTCHVDNRRQRAELAAFLQEAGAPGLLFDVGAHSGVFSLLYCRAHAAARAVSFEPSRLLAARLDANRRLNALGGRLSIVPAAVGAASGAIEMFESGGNGWVQVRPFAGTTQDAWTRVALDATTLDREAQRWGVPSVIKIDVEGYEHEVLLGSTSLLAGARPVIFLELHLNYLEERGIDATGIIRLLERFDYQLCSLAGRRLSVRTILNSWTNVLHLIARPA